MKRLGFVLPLFVSLAACSPAAPKPASPFSEPGPGATSASSGSALERFFPLVHGNLWHYDTTSDDGERGRLVVRARRASDKAGELVTPSGTRHFAYESEGIALLGRSVFVLEAPLAVGTNWRGEHGGATRVESVGVSVTVPAGRFDGCVVTIEDRGGDTPARYTTTFCPDVGITVLDVEAGMQHERAELRSYGPPVNIGPDGSSFSGP